MRNVFKQIGVITLVAIIGFSFAACGDGGGGGGGGGNPTWPAEFGGATQYGTDWGSRHSSPPCYINFYTSTGGSGTAAYMQFSGDTYGSRLVSVNGQTLKVKNISYGDKVFTLCTSWNIEGNSLTLSGGDTLFSTIMNKPLNKN